MLRECYAFGSRGAEWTKTRPMPIQLSHHAVASVGDNYFVFGGHDGRSVTNKVTFFLLYRKSSTNRRTDSTVYDYNLPFMPGLNNIGPPLI